jgi:hypothetical protein
MTIEQQREEANASPALKWRCDKPGRSHYPYNWFDKVPLKVKMATTVKSDLSGVIPTHENIVALARGEYYVWVNSYGAVSAILSNGEQLGLMPSEFVVTEWHETKV